MSIENSELGSVLREQQATISLLLSRTPLANGHHRHEVLEALARSLSAHLFVWRSLLLPRIDPTHLAIQTAAGTADVEEALRLTMAEHGRGGARVHVHGLIRSVLALISCESALIRTGFDELPEMTLSSLAADADAAYTRLAGSLDIESMEV
jgi:hypothetical protein